MAWVPSALLLWLIGLSMPWEKFKLLHLGCAERSIMSPPVSQSLGVALCQCLALLLGECWRALNQKTMQMEKLASSPDRITSPYVFFRKSTVSLTPYMICKQNRAAHCCLTPAAEALAEHRGSARTHSSALTTKRAFQSTQPIH